MGTEPGDTPGSREGRARAGVRKPEGSGHLAQKGITKAVLKDSREGWVTAGRDAPYLGTHTHPQLLKFLLSASIGV